MFLIEAAMIGFLGSAIGLIIRLDFRLSTSRRAMKLSVPSALRTE